MGKKCKVSESVFIKIKKLLKPINLSLLSLVLRAENASDIFENESDQNHNKLDITSKDLLHLRVIISTKVSEKKTKNVLQNQKER